nr:Macro domain-containing protein [Ipomoea batatas]
MACGGADVDGGAGVEFELRPSTLVKIVRGKIAQWSVDGSSDAIVNPTNERMLGGGGTDGAIHRAAGPQLREACYKVPEARPGIRCPTGEARITPGFKLAASHVILTAGPVYASHPHPKSALESSYRNCLRLAKENNIQYIAFPAISCGYFGYPFDDAAKVAVSTIKEFGTDFKENQPMISAPVSGIGSTLFRFLTTRTAPPIKLRNSHFRPPGNYVGASFSIMASAGADDRNAVQFQLTPSSLLKILKGDITQWSVDGSSDAIVNPANERMLGGGGADGAIHRAAGPELREACYKVPEVRPGVRCPTGEARITLGFKLPASHVIHTVGPIYDAHPDPKAALENSYRNSLQVAKENSIQYIAFPAISCGVYGYPFDEAANVAVSTVKEHGSELKEVHFVLFSDEIFNAWLKAANKLLQN